MQQLVEYKKGEKMKTKYLVKLNGKVISTRVRRKKTATLKILFDDKLGVWKYVDTYYDVHLPKHLVETKSKGDNPNIIYYDWSIFTKVGDNYEANFIYSPNQQKIDIKKNQLNKEGN